MKILVPHNRTIKEYVHRTGNFQSDIVAIVKEKQGQYTIWFRAEGTIKLLSFKLLHVCALKHEKVKKEVTCPVHESESDEPKIANIIYSKTTPDIE